jgi:putative chitinase
VGVRVLTLEALDKIMPDAGERCALFYPFLVRYMPVYRIEGRLRETAFLATIAEESGELQYTREIWGPTPAQKTYEGRVDLGNTEPGDGRRFKGRGLISITGRDNYRKASQALGVDYVTNPELMQYPEEATRTACWWWGAHGLNELADVPDFVAVTRRVNGGLTHFDRREAFYSRAMEVLA